MLLFCLYATILIGLGLWDARRARNNTAFFLNSRSSGARQVAFSLTASCIGSSSTIGMAGLAWALGAPAFWWLGAGSIGLAVLALFLAEKVRGSGAWTTPELVGIYLGPQARMLVAAILVPAWLALMAAQFTAMGKCTEALTGLSPEVSLLAGSGLLILYSVLGGWASVIRSDQPQGTLFLLGLSAAAFCLWQQDPTPLAELDLALLNADFGPDRLIYFLIIVGGSYVAGPTMFGILLSAKDRKSSVHGCGTASFILLGASVLITALGVLCRGPVPPGTASDDILVSAITSMPPWAGMALLVALFSAVISSADSMLVTVSTVVCNDLFQRRSTALCRMVTLAFGAGGLLLSTQGHGILDLLLIGYDVYVSGVAAPVTVALLLASKPGPKHPELGTAAIALGGLCGLAAAITSLHAFCYAGMALSAMLTVLAVRRKNCA
ncbi:MAG: sodium:solute symporter family protein [Mailhella sp.]|nr:sodium:solute symporter family protein [Mailhella sp.]